MEFTVFEAGCGGPHDVKHVAIAKSAAEAKRQISRNCGIPLFELTAVKGTEEKAERKFFSMEQAT